MPAAPLQPGDPINTSETDTETARRCVACGYNLFGLGDEPRCPECGLLNIPSGYRQQVWDLVDSGQWFFSSFFGTFRKRPPGWWWALDRPGDVKRSFKFAGRCALIAAVMILAFGFLADLFRVELTIVYSLTAPNDPPGSKTDAGELIYVHGMGGYIHEFRDNVDYAVINSRGWAGVTLTTRSRLLFKPALQFITPCGMFFIGIFLIWAGPAMVGLWTQIRKGLPDFARPPRTILAASNYESHRLLYLSTLSAIWLVADTALRVVVFPTIPMSLQGLRLAYTLAFWALGAAGWIGPLRSDYTRQLVRSRFHAARIVVMYAVILPWVITVIITGTAAQLLSWI